MALTEGSIVEYEGRHWRVGLVNECRARLDPLDGRAVTVKPNGDEGHVRQFTTYGPSVNVSPHSLLSAVDDSELGSTARRRLNTLKEQTMAEVAAVPIPTKAAKAKPATKKAATKREPKAKELRPCACGCGAKTASYFVPGHDARFKSWLLNIERGKTALHGTEMKDGQTRTPLPRKVQEQYKWVKRGTGFIPTTNYKGEPHKGYE